MPKNKTEKRKKVCLISSSGGHYEQLSMLRPLEKKFDIFWVSEKTEYKGSADYCLPRPGRKNLMFPFRMLRTLWCSFKVWIKEKPDAVVTTGTMVAMPMCMLAKLFGKKVIFIETFARVTDCTSAGKFMYKFADLFIYQWEQLGKFYPNGVYGGSIY